MRYERDGTRFAIAIVNRMPEGMGILLPWLTAKMKNRLNAPAFALALALLIFNACGKDPQPREATLGSGELHWARFPVTIRMDTSLLDGAYAEEDMLAAIAFWENRAGRPLFQVDQWPLGPLPFTGPASDPNTLTDNAVFFLKPWPSEWGNRVAGKTIIHAYGNIIKNAVVFLNSETALCSGLCHAELDRTSRRKLLAHELGHFLGFAHVADRMDLMFPEILPGGSLESVRIDEQLLKKLTNF